ncbi:glycoside hydrolase [Dipodascopsis uninucleata]
MTKSIKHACFVFSHGLMTYYNGNQTGQTPGMFVSPYYWWEAGAAWGSLIEYWFLTGDDTYNDQVRSSLLFQTGSNNNYMPSNQTTAEGNDDQAFWGFTVMTAAERNFTNPSPDEPQWLALAEAVFNSLAARWDTSTCDGGLRWQIYQFNSGYDYKNTISNAGLFLMAARLARYTGNDTYVDWAEKTWDWIEDVGLLDTRWYYFYDGVNSDVACNNISKYQWSYNAGAFLAGSAYLYNYTEDEVWYNRTANILGGLDVFFDSTGIMYEVACEKTGNCNVDEKSFKAYLSRFLGYTAVLAPFTYDIIMNHIKATIPGIASSCTGGSDNVTCGVTWLTGTWDGTWGLGQQMCALETTQQLLISNVPPPYTSTDGGTSTGTSNETSSSIGSISSASRAGAGIITAIVLLLMLGASWWIVV